MKLSEKLQRDHEGGDFGKALTGYPEAAEALENRIAELEHDLSTARQHVLILLNRIKP